MAFMIWSDKLSVGVQQMDMQHKILVELVNELCEAIKSGKGNDVLGGVLNGLITYTKTHFKAEEKLMQQYGYPNFPGHKKLHDELTSQAVELNEKIKSGQAVTAVSVGNFLKDWLQNHIMIEDMKYGQFIAQHQTTS